jgi:hypothetical protein
MKLTIVKTGKPLNHTFWTFTYLACFLFGLCIQGFAKTAKLTTQVHFDWQQPTLYERYEESMRRHYLFQVAYQTTDCIHDSTRIGYYDNLRTFPGKVLELTDTDLIIGCRDQFEVARRQFHTNETTEYMDRKGVTAIRVSREFLVKHKGDSWMAVYCVHCRTVFEMVHQGDAP